MSGPDTWRGPLVTGWPTAPAGRLRLAGLHSMRVEHHSQRSATSASSTARPRRAGGGFMLVTGRTGPGRRRCCGSAPGCSRRPAVTLDVDAAARNDRLPRPRAARLPGADGAREPRPVRPAVPRARAARADRDAARALRALASAERAGGDFLARDARSGSGSAARSCTSRTCCCSTSRSTRSTRRAPTLLDRRARPSAPAATAVLVATHDPGPRREPRGDWRGWRSHELRRRRRRARAEGPPARAARTRDAAGDAAVRRLGARRLPLRAALRLLRRSPRRAALGRDRLHRAARAHPGVRGRARAGGARRARARAVRPQRDLAREDDRGAGVPRRSPSSSRCPRSRSSSTALSGRPSPRSRSPTSGSAPSARCSPRWPPPAAPASCSCRCCSCRSRSRSSSAAWARAWPATGRYPRLPRALRRRFLAILSWATFEYVVTE